MGETVFGVSHKTWSPSGFQSKPAVVLTGPKERTHFPSPWTQPARWPGTLPWHGAGPEIVIDFLRGRLVGERRQRRSVCPDGFPAYSVFQCRAELPSSFSSWAARWQQRGHGQCHEGRAEQSASENRVYHSGFSLSLWDVAVWPEYNSDIVSG